MASEPVLQTDLDFPVRRGKVRDVYDLGDSLLLVTTDRISAYDYVLPTAIPDKGRVLTQTSMYWFDQLGETNHIITADVNEMGLPDNAPLDQLAGRTMKVKKCEVVPIECVIRGYLSGSGWKEYQDSETICGIQLSSGLVESDRFESPIFTPATKEEDGHDVNISYERMVEIVGEAVASELRDRSMSVYQRGAELALKQGIIIADTKFEWGRFGDELILIDEVMTPDSSRFWPADQYQPGQGQPSYDKQFVRDWLSNSGWDKNSDPPELPEEIVQKTREKYIEAYEQLTQKAFPWK